MHGWVLRGMAAGALLFCAAAQAALVNSDFKISPDISLDSLALSAGTDTYLAVWRNVSAVPPRIEGATVSMTGVASAAFVLSGPAAQPALHPVQQYRVAFDGQQFLVVWADTVPGSMGVHGAFVSRQGVVQGNFLIAATVNSTGVNPQVVYSGSSYLVAWHDAPLSGNGTQLFAARVTAAGVVGMIHSVPAVPGTVVNQSLSFPLAGASGEVLLLYRNAGASPVTTYGTRVAADGSIASPGTKLLTLDFAGGGAGAAIGGAFVGTEYVILASRGANLDCAVTRVWLHADNSVALSTVPFALVGQGHTGFAEDNFPMTYFNGSSEFLFVRNTKVADVSYHEMIKRVLLNGTDNDPYMPVVDTSSSGGMNGAVAAALGSQYLVAWMDGRRRVADPPFQTDVFGALIDATQLGNTLKPVFKVAPSMVPQVGTAPLTVQVGSGFSTGIPDSTHWDFGDGGTSELSAASHIYKTAGSYVATYSLVKLGLYYSFSFIAYIGGDGVGGAGNGGGSGPPESVTGVLPAPSPGINTEVAVSSLAVNLDFTKSGNDSFKISGEFNPTNFPVYYPLRTFTATLGSKVYSFQLTTSGTFVSAAGATPFLNFGVNPFTGDFTLISSLDDLTGVMAAAGAANATVSKVPVGVPISVSFGVQSSTQTVVGQYTATQGKTGKFSYVFGTTGSTGEGFIQILQGVATERTIGGKVPVVVDDVTVVGVLALPGNKTVTKADTGNWTVHAGNFSQDIPVASLTLTSGIYNFKPAGVKAGVSQFSFSQKSGSFLLIVKGLPTQGVDTSGLPDSTVSYTSADMAVSLNLALSGGGSFTGGGYLRLRRGAPGKKKWVLR